MRIFALSDIHLDYSVNLDWLKRLSLQDYQNDILILAGDVSDRIELLETCFETLLARFQDVLFVPGNHDLWVSRSDEKDSLQKLYRLRELADDYGIVMEPHHSGSVSIVPLYSWYDFSFGEPNAELRQTWMDFRACVWPEEFAITQYFLNENLAALDTRNDTLISFSHFLPRIDVMPSFIPPSRRFLYPVLGSRLLDEQIRTLGADIHVYGHSHVNREVSIDGVRYINNAFGYPSETFIAAKNMKCIFEG